MDNDVDPLFKPEDLKQWLGETPKPLVIDVEPLRMCSEQIGLISHEVIRIIEKTLAHIRTVLPTMPIGRHLRLVTLHKLPGSIFLQTQKTPWGKGALLLHQGVCNLLISALQKNGLPSERVPPGIMEPATPENPDSIFSANLIVEDDPDSIIVLAPEDAEVTEDGHYPEGALSFYEKSAFHIYGTKWKNPSSLPSPPWKIPPVDFSKDRD